MSSSEKRQLMQIADGLKAIAHPVRIRILQLICNQKAGRLTVKQIYESLQTEQPETSRHLNIMKKCGVLDAEKKGTHTCYFINNTHPIAACLESMLSKMTP